MITDDYKQIVRENVVNEKGFIKATFSGQQRDQLIPWLKVVVRPVVVQGRKHLQFSYFDAHKDITKNYRDDDMIEKLEQLLGLTFKDIHIETIHNSIHIAITKKGKPIVHRKKTSSTDTKEPILSHDRQKKVLLAGEDAAPFLKELGIMGEDNKIKVDMQSKFRQINEFLKLVQQTGALEKLSDTPVSVVDCGCGNAYLTFAFYYYLHSVLNIPTHLTGIDDRSEPLVRHTEKTSRLGWPDLTFQTSKIIDFQPAIPPDIVLALHACDTATDEALCQGIKWQSKLIVSVPCCQHHLQEQLEHQPTPDLFQPVLRHSILKERIGDILTDTFRALVLRIMGYQTEVIQFVSSQHTAKNLMIRAVKSYKVGEPKFIQEYKDLKNFWNVTPYLEQLLGDNFTSLL